jgi:alpha-glucosidase
MRFEYLGLLAVAGVASAQDPNSCPGYKATNVKKESGGVTADLTLNGNPCNIYGNDLKNLQLLVEYQTGEL